MLFPESSYPTVNISNEAVHWKEKKNMKEKKLFCSSFKECSIVDQAGN